MTDFKNIDKISHRPGVCLSADDADDIVRRAFEGKTTLDDILVLFDHAKFLYAEKKNAG